MLQKSSWPSSKIQIIYLIKISLNFSMKSFHESDCNNSILYLDTEAITSK